MNTTTLTKEPPTVKITPFTGESFSITIPTTSKSLTFSKVETTRGDINNRWTYPSPLPAMGDSFKDKKERLVKYTEILGDERVISILEDALQRLSQDNWRAVATPEELEEGEEPSEPFTQEELIKEFCDSFITGKTREGITSMGLARKMNTCRALAMKFKKEDGGKVTPRVKEQMDKARQWHAKYLEQSAKEMENV